MTTNNGKTKVLVGGCNGRMGQILCRLIDKSEDFTVQYGFDKEAWEWSTFCACTSLNEIESMESYPDIIIDFSAPDATMELARFAAKHNIPIVIATTGIAPCDMRELGKIAMQIPLFQSANMSYQVALMKNLVKTAASALSDADIEITETHHNRKKDCPSGTALMLANAIKEVLSEKAKIYGRIGKREKNEIGISSIRGGNIPGSHTVYFFSENETFEIIHRDHSPEVFAEGALKAATFLLSKGPGFYDMDDLFSL